MQDEVLRVDVDQLHPAPWNRDIGDVEELAQSITAIGLIEPVVVRPNGDGKSFVIVAGERRWAATKKAGFSQIQVIVRALDDRQALEAQLVENLQRKDIAPLEEAEGYRRLLELGMKQVEVSQRIGRSQAHVSKRLALLELPEKAQSALSAGKIVIEDALELVKLKDMPKRLATVLERDGSGYGGIRYAVQDQLRAHTKAEKVGAVKQKLKQTGIKVVGRPGYNSKTRLLGGSDMYRPGLGLNVNAHKKEPCHAAYIDDYPPYKAVHVCTDPERHGPKGDSELKIPADNEALKSAKQRTSIDKAQEREEKARAAMDEQTRRRRAFVVDLITNLRGKQIAKEEVWTLVGSAIAFADIYRTNEHAAAIALGIADEKPDEQRHRRFEPEVVHKYVRQSASNLMRYAFAVACFAGEHAADQILEPYCREERGGADWYLDFLVRHGYELSELETKKLRATS